MEKDFVFLGHEELDNIKDLRKAGKLDEAEKILLGGLPTPAVLDELRKIASTRARQAKKAGDWKAVIRNLSGYQEYAQKWQWYCRKTVNAEPPEHTISDQALLLEAMAKVNPVN